MCQLNCFSTFEVKYYCIGMHDFYEIKKHCEAIRFTSASVVDEYLIYYAAKRDKKDKEFDTKISRFKRAIREMPDSWIRVLKSQFIAHEIFKHGGLISKYLNHVAIKEFDAGHKQFLNHCAAHPWKFSFSIILKSPFEDFYEMEDVFTGQSFLLYSPGVSRTLSETNVRLWFNLISFNGICWQTFGPVSHFQSFDSDDIYFFATEMHSAISSDSELLENIESNPIPYAMLMVGSNYPLIKNQEFEMVQTVGEIETELFDGNTLRKNLKVEYADGVYRVSDENWMKFPHHAEAFYDEGKGTFSLFALTETGYVQMAHMLAGHGYDFPEEPDVRVHLSMLNTIETLLEKKIVLNPYSEKFQVDNDPDTEELLEAINEIVALAVIEINAGRDFDIRKAADAFGINEEVVEKVVIPAIEGLRQARGKK